MRTNVSTLVALYAVVRDPFGNESGHAALLIAGGRLLPCAVLDTLEVRHLEQVAVLCVDRTHELVDEFRIVVLHLGILGKIAPRRIDIELGILAATVYGGIVLVHDILTLLAIALHDELLHLLYGQIHRNHLGDAEERALEDRIGAVAQTDLLSYLGCVDIIYGDIVVGKVLLHLVGKILGQLLALPDSVEQEGAAVAQTACHIIQMQISLNVASNEVGRGHQICGADRLVAETQVRAGEAARLLRVVGEVGLTVFIGIVADDLHRVLVGAHGTVSTQTIELGLEHRVAHHDRSYRGQRAEVHVVDYADGEVILRLRQSQIVVNGDHVGRSGVLRRQTETAGVDGRSVGAVLVHLAHVEIERLARSARLLGAVEHSDALRGGGDSSEKMLRRERTEQMNAHQTHLLALGHQMVYGFLSGLCARTHGDDHALGLGIAIIVEEVIFAAGDGGNLLHVVLHDLGNSLIYGVARLAVLEEHVAVLGHAAGNGSIRIESAVAESGHGVAIEQRSEILLFEHLDLLDLVRGTEAVEEVQERYTRLDRCQMSHTRQIHYLLHRTLGQHGEAGLAGRHHVLMVAEDAQRVRSDRACRYMKHARKHLAGYLVHVRNHQQQTLRCSVGRCQSACLQRAVNRTRCTALRLHLLHENRLAEDILTAGCGPFVNVFCHRRRRGDRVNGRHFRKHVRNVGCCLITVTSQEFLFLTHKSVIYVCLDGYESLVLVIMSYTQPSEHFATQREVTTFFRKINTPRPLRSPLSPLIFHNKPHTMPTTRPHRTSTAHKTPHFQHRKK